jgi:hypothetical protein
MRENLGSSDAVQAGLTLHELGELIRRAGRAEGYTVRSEYPVGRGKRNSLHVDWVWLEGLNPVMAIEIEGRNVPESSLMGDLRKFQELPPACVRVVALYTVRGERSLSLPLKRDHPAKWFQKKWQMGAVLVTSDTELLAPGGIEGLQDLARRRPLA